MQSIGADEMINLILVVVIGFIVLDLIWGKD